MSESPPQGLVIDYTEMTAIPVIQYDSSSNAIIFDNPVQTTGGIASSDQTPLSFNSPAVFNSGISAGVNADFSQFVPMPLPSDPMSLNIPAINSMGTLQATDILIAKNGSMSLYVDSSGTRFYSDITVDGNIINTELQNQLNLKAPLDNPSFTGTVTGITKSMVGLDNVDNTTDLLKPISTATQTALDLKANLASPAFTGTVTGITKAMVGLGNVDNTTDLLKPVSTATQTALDLKANLNNPTFTGTLTAPTINASTALQIGGVSSDTLYQQRAFIMAVIPVGTTGQAVSGVSWNGTATSFTVTKTGTGAYRFDWTPALPSTYVFMGNLRNAAGFVSFNGAGTAGLNCQTYNFSGSTVAQADISSGFHVMLFRNP
jgi:hypothetical protein